MKLKSSSRKRALSADEAELWAHAMRDTKALRRRRTSATQPDVSATASPSVVEPTAPAATDHSKAKKLSLADRPPMPTAQLKSPAQPPLARFDDRQRRKLARNSELIDARLDLHGMRQREAHSALRGFLYTCAARGQRNVLVITGKGTRAEIERSRDHFMEEPGVLRRLVPQWFREPEFRALVISYATAGARHGGEGALYVRLRKFSGD